MVLTICKRPNSSLSSSSSASWEDPRQRFGYNPALEAKPVTPDQLKKVMSKNGSLAGTKQELFEKYQTTVGSTQLAKPKGVKSAKL